MQVQKRGSRGFETVKFDKITKRISVLCDNLSPSIDSSVMALETIKQLHNNITTSEIDQISARIAEGQKLIHPDYSILAAKIMVSNLHKITPDSFSECMDLLHKNLNIISDHHHEFIMKHRDELDRMIIKDNDFLLDYLGYKTLENAYLHKINIALEGAVTRQIMDRPQYLYMRTAIALHMDIPDTNEQILNNIRESYLAFSEMYFTHATPTLFNSCAKSQQLLSCFLLGTEDSIEGIMSNLTNASLISKRAGGIGIHMSNIRSRGSYIRGTNGSSSGLPRQLKMYDAAAVCWDQGGKRRGAFAIYIEPWHADIMSFLRLKLSQGDDAERARDLFYAVWIPDLFMRKFEAGAEWHLFSEDTAPGLSELYDGMEVCTKCNYCVSPSYVKYHSAPTIQNCAHEFGAVDAFTDLYNRYAAAGLARETIPATDVVTAICEMQRESGTPYVCFKDSVNRQTNQSNAGTIKSSNLCVTPDTYVLTDKGQFMIKDLVDKPVNVWNGEKFTETIPRKTGENQKILTVTLSNGTFISCTPYHKFVVENNVGDFVKVAAQYLVSGTKLASYSLPVIDDGPDDKRAFYYGSASAQNSQRDVVLPEHNSLKTKLEWFRGYWIGMGAKGQIVNGELLSLSCICSMATTDFTHIRLMLQTMGVDSEILEVRDESTGYNLDHLYISTAGVYTLHQLGFYSYPNITVPKSTEPVTVTVAFVDFDDDYEDTYCFTESERGMGMFNGVLTGNCAEIMQVSAADSYACCTLASINLQKFLDADNVIDHEKLYAYVRMAVRNLDNIVTVNDYPVKECINNALSLRPIGLGVQALANVFNRMRIPFLSPEAERVDLEIFETIYHAAVTESVQLAKERGAYPLFHGSPTSHGELAPDLWRKNQVRLAGDLGRQNIFSGRYDFEALRESAKTGTRNSLLIALMPTVSTSQTLGNNESFEPFASNIYTKNTLAGKFTITNSHMINHLMELGLWSEQMKNRIINNDGSLTGITEIPAAVRAVYQTVWELKQSEIMRRAALRQAFVDQSQSLNIHAQNNNNATLRGILLHGWRLGLKTGSYYIRTKPAAQALKNNITSSAAAVISTLNVATTTTVGGVCTMSEGCVMCSS